MLSKYRGEVRSGLPTDLEMLAAGLGNAKPDRLPGMAQTHSMSLLPWWLRRCDCY
jgi:hypothetical protein